MKKKSIKPILLKLPYLAFVYLFNKLCQAIRLSMREDVMETLLSMGEGFAEAFDRKELSLGYDRMPSVCIDKKRALFVL